MRLTGLDIGFSRDRPSTGVAILHDEHLVLHRSPAGDPAIRSLLSGAPYDAIAIDGPLLPEAAEDDVVRAVERAFSLGAFQRRCKPGMSHVAGTGRMLRATAQAAADDLARAGAAPAKNVAIPQVRSGQAIVEAFPNCFLGVCVPEADFATQPRLARGHKFDWLYERWCAHGLFRSIMGDAFLASRCEVTTDHEERAALVCLLTALGLHTRRFTVAGNASGGWFVLPPLEAWQPWARAALDQSMRRLHAGGSALERITG